MIDYILIGTPGPTELIIILVLVLILFGAKRIPEIAQGLGKGIREFKKSVHEIKDEIDTPEPKLVKDKKEAKAKTDKTEDEKNG
ncbi:MAG: twin-arginine translocase TatA/TatE family subunit [candidate division Zixibacteria bacterium]|nr:twin-arginine translocase TatA/TatE family subunit [candidate division Zixibacteria bacterium]